MVFEATCCHLSEPFFFFLALFVEASHDHRDNMAHHPHCYWCCGIFFFFKSPLSCIDDMNNTYMQHIFIACSTGTNQAVVIVKITSKYLEQLQQGVYLSAKILIAKIRSQKPMNSFQCGFFLGFNIYCERSYLQTS